MKNNKTNYRLVARMQGEKLTMNREVMEELTALYDHRVAALYRKEHNADRRALLASVEIEHKGDFLWACGAQVSALKAYIEAAGLALDGTYYDWDRSSYPAYTLYHRSRELVHKIKQCAAHDPRLSAMLREDRSFALLKPWREWVEAYDC